MSIAAPGQQRGDADVLAAPNALAPLVSRLDMVPPATPAVTTPGELYEAAGRPIADLHQEQLRVVLFNATHRVITVHLVAMGSANLVQCALHDCFTEAVRRGASAIALLHNHPGATLTPSQDDLRFTARAVAAGELLNIPVLDHLIVGPLPPGYCSLREEGY